MPVAIGLLISRPSITEIIMDYQCTQESHRGKQQGQCQSDKRQKDGPVTAGLKTQIKERKQAMAGKAHYPLPCPERNKLSRPEFGTLLSPLSRKPIKYFVWLLTGNVHCRL